MEDIMRGVDTVIGSRLNELASIPLWDGMTVGQLGATFFDFAQSSIPMTIIYVATSIITIAGTYNGYKAYKSVFDNPELKAELGKFSRLQRVKMKFKIWNENTKVRREFFGGIVANKMLDYLKSLEEDKKADLAQGAISNVALASLNEDDSTKKIGEDFGNTTYEYPTGQDCFDAGGLEMTDEAYNASVTNAIKPKQANDETIKEIMVDDESMTNGK